MENGFGLRKSPFIIHLRFHQSYPYLEYIRNLNIKAIDYDAKKLYLTQEAWFVLKSENTINYTLSRPNSNIPFETSATV